MKRQFDCTENTRRLRITVFKDDSGQLSAIAEEPGDVVAHSITLIGKKLAFAKRLFETDELDLIPHLNLDLAQITDSDACALVELPSYFLNQLSDLSQFLAKYDLQYPSHHKRIADCLHFARQWVKLGQDVAKLERSVRQMILNLEPLKLAQPPQFFDGWGDGPFTYIDVLGFAKERPEAAAQFHTDGNVSFLEYQQKVAHEEARRRQNDHPRPHFDKKHSMAWGYNLVRSLLTALSSIVSMMTNWR